MVKTVTLTAGSPQAVTFSEAYPFYWIDNKTSGDVYASVGGTPEPDTDGTYTISAGSQLRISGGVGNGGITLLGNGKVQVVASGIAECPFKAAKKGGDIELLPKPIGLTEFFDYQNGIDIFNKTWTDSVSGTVCTADGKFNVSENCLEMNNQSFSLGYGEGLSSHTIYAIVCAKEYISGWTSLIASYGDTPQFNVCSYNGKLAIGTGQADGRYNNGTIPSYGEWHVCCITADEGFGAFYIDGTEVYSYNGYSKPQYTDEIPLYFGYGNIKMLAVCPNVAHGASIVAENSGYLKKKYIKSE